MSEVIQDPESDLVIQVEVLMESVCQDVWLQGVQCREVGQKTSGRRVGKLRVFVDGSDDVRGPDVQFGGGQAANRSGRECAVYDLQKWPSPRQIYNYN